TRPTTSSDSSVDVLPFAPMPQHVSSPAPAVVHTPVAPATPLHSKPAGQVSSLPTTQSCVQYMPSDALRQLPLRQNWLYVHASPTLPLAGSQKHLPASHFWPFAHASALVHGAPLVTVIVGAIVSASMSSYALTTM